MTSILEGWTRPDAEGDFDEKHFRLIDEHRWALLGVFDPDGDDPRFTYSAGILEAFGAPEVISFGLSFDMLKWLCNEYGSRIREGQAMPLERDLDGFIKDYPVRLIDVDTSRPEVFSEYLCWSHWYYGRRDFPIRQIVWPDAEGRFPWDPECAPAVIRDQPLLGRLKS